MRFWRASEQMSDYAMKKVMQITISELKMSRISEVVFMRNGTKVVFSLPNLLRFLRQMRMATKAVRKWK